ncbi:hypothetical protein [Fusobacterium necrophorum]|uniref:hypothetical protein n=1 Tax=Fusobacterium necrophorum TaxID=859 RepID=UPI003F9ECEDB
MIFKKMSEAFRILIERKVEIDIIETENTLKYHKKSEELQEAYFFLKKIIYFLILTIMIIFIILKEYIHFNFFQSFLLFFPIIFFLFLSDKFSIYKYCSEILIFSNSITLRYQIRNKILYERELRFCDFMEIKVQIPEKNLIHSFFSEIKKVLEEDRILKIIGKEETFSWGYRISEKEAIEVKKRIEKKLPDLIEKSKKNQPPKWHSWQ